MAVAGCALVAAVPRGVEASPAVSNAMHTVDKEAVRTAATLARVGQCVDLKTAEDKIARQQERLMNAKSTHEVNSLQRDIAALQKARGDLDEAILILMDDTESSAKRLVQLQQELDEKSAQTAVTERHFAAE